MTVVLPKSHDGLGTRAHEIRHDLSASASQQLLAESSGIKEILGPSKSSRECVNIPL